MTLPRLAAFNRAWRDRPPLALLARALVGYAPPREAAHERARGPAEFLAWFKASGGKAP